MNTVPSSRTGVATRIQQERKKRGWDVPEMARRLAQAAGGDRSGLPDHATLVDYIRKRWENGKFSLSERYRILYSRAFQMDDSELFAGNNSGSAEDVGFNRSLSLDLLPLAWTVGRLDSCMDRRTVLQLAATLPAVPALGMVDPIERLTRALSRPSGIDEEMVDYLAARSVGFHRLEFMFPADQLFRGLLAHLNEITSLLEICPKDRLRKRLASLAGESAVLGAWVAWDLGDHSRAAALYRVAELAAKEGSDMAIVACSVIYQSFAMQVPGARLEARRMLRDAQQLLPQRADLATRAWLMGREAEEAAAIGDASATDIIEAASELMARARPQSERSWTRCLEDPRLTHMRLTVATRLKDEAAVHENVHQLMSLAGDPARKRTGRILASVGLALTAIGDTSEAVKLGQRAVEAIKLSKAMYAMDRLSELGVALGEKQDNQSVRQLCQQVTATRRTLASPRPPIPNNLLGRH